MRQLIVVALLLLLGAARTAAQTPPLATYVLTAGWATFGLPLAQGQARDGVTACGQPTQTDVKARWPDGSIRFAVVTIKAEARPCAIVAGPASGPAHTVAPKALTVSLSDIWANAAPASHSVDRWLAGPLVVESRHVLGGHPFLKAYVDVRSYADGATAADVTIENALNTEGTRVAYVAQISVGGEVRYTSPSLEHRYLTRWVATVVDTSFIPARVTPDTAAWMRSGAVPTFRASVPSPSRSIAGAPFNPLAVGDLHVPMNDVGGREEIAPLPYWAAQALVHRRRDQLAYVVKHGELAGSWAVHVREADGSLVSIDAKPDYWLDSRAPAGQKPGGDLTDTGPGADSAHAPSLAFVPYLLTGRRYFADEMAFWANYALLRTWPGDSGALRAGRPHHEGQTAARGIINTTYEQVRGFGWAVRNLADAAAFLPDDDPRKTYLTTKLRNNLEWADAMVGTDHPLGIWAWTYQQRPEGLGVIAPWEQAYASYGIARANLLGFTGGEKARDALINVWLQLLTASTSRTFPRSVYPYTLRIASGSTPAANWAAVLKLSGDLGTGDSYSPEAHLATTLGEIFRLPLAAAARAVLKANFSRSSKKAPVERADEWSGFALAVPAATP